MKKIELVNGGEALVDDDDYEVLSRYTWGITKDGYAIRFDDFYFGKKRPIYMHHLIHISKNDMEIDHIDTNKLNNQKSNLRTVTKSQNAQNRTKKENLTSKYIGVHLADGKWVAQIKKNGRVYYLGTYKYECVAALAYNRAAKKMYGGLARINVW